MDINELLKDARDKAEGVEKLLQAIFKEAHFTANASGRQTGVFIGIPYASKDAENNEGVVSIYRDAIPELVTRLASMSCYHLKMVEGRSLEQLAAWATKILEDAYSWKEPLGVKLGTPEEPSNHCLIIFFNLGDIRISLPPFSVMNAEAVVIQRTEDGGMEEFKKITYPETA